MEFTEEEMLFTKIEIINHAIANITEFDEIEWAIELLDALKRLINGSVEESQEEAKVYWTSQTAPFDYDLEEVLHYLCANINDPTHEIRTSVYTKVLA